MKVILTGSTGFVGSEVLKQCCASSEITSIIALTRRPLAREVAHDKLQNIVMADFRIYSPEVAAAISDADACIWCLGGAAADIEVDYPVAFCQAVTQNWSSRTKPFRYVHCSGVLAEKDQNKRLWFLEEGRHAKGRAETLLVKFATAEEQRGPWQSYIMRPSMIMPTDPSIAQKLLGRLLGSVNVDDLGRASIVLASHGDESNFAENGELVRLGSSTSLYKHS